ncbi:hypothetical protein CRYUN_Cryun17cG0090000 [Craigia yunnanensis]
MFWWPIGSLVDVTIRMHSRPWLPKHCHLLLQEVLIEVFAWSRHWHKSEVWLCYNLKSEVLGKISFFCWIDKVRFRKSVIAGDTLVMRMTLIKLQKWLGIAKMERKACFGGDLICEGEFLMVTVSD